MLLLFWPVLLATVSTVLLGMIWYHPLVFGAAWMRLGHITPERVEYAAQTASVRSAASFAANFVLSAALSFVARLLGLEGVADSLLLALGAWLGFVVPLLASSILWEQRALRFYVINVSYWLVALMLAAVIIVP